MRILGINCLKHDMACSLLTVKRYCGKLHAERYSKIKNDQYLNQQIVDEAMSYGPFDLVVYYEKAWLKKWRQFKG